MVNSKNKITLIYFAIVFVKLTYRFYDGVCFGTPQPPNPTRMCALTHTNTLSNYSVATLNLLGVASSLT